MSEHNTLDKLIPSASQYKSLKNRSDKYHEALHSEHGVNAMEYLKARKLDESTINYFKLGYVHEPEIEDHSMRGRISIPYHTLHAGVRALRFKAIDGREPKALEGETRPGLFNSPVISEGGEDLYICEGEEDAMILHQLSLNAVAYPGVQRIEEWHERLFEGYTRVYLCGDGDDPGRKFNQRLKEMVPGPIMIDLPEGNDITDVYKSGGRKAIMSLLGKDK